MTIKEKETARRDFIRGALAVAQSRGISAAEIKRKCFSSYATGNRRIEHKHGELNLTEIFNIASLCRISPAAFIQMASENMKN